MVLPLVWSERPYMKASSSICWSGLPSLRWPVTRNSGPAILELWKYCRPADLERNWKMSLRPASLMMNPSSDFCISCFCCSSGPNGAPAAGVTATAGVEVAGASGSPEGAGKSAGAGRSDGAVRSEGPSTAGAAGADGSSVATRSDVCASLVAATGSIRASAGF